MLRKGSALPRNDKGVGGLTPLLAMRKEKNTPRNDENKALIGRRGMRALLAIKEKKIALPRKDKERKLIGIPKQYNKRKNYY